MNVKLIAPSCGGSHSIVSETSRKTDYSDSNLSPTIRSWITRSAARFQDDGTTTHKTAFNPLPESRYGQLQLPYNINELLAKITQSKPQSNLRFSHITSDREWEKLKQFRLQLYKEKKPYMITALDQDGSCQYDQHSYTYCAWWDDEPIATIRLTPYPFETLQHIDEAVLKDFVGNQWKKQYLEWSRLLVIPKLPIKNLTQALLTYAGINTLAFSPYNFYFGYTTPLVRRILARQYDFQGTLDFSIPSRNNNQYKLLKGDFTHDLNKVITNLENKKDI